MRRFMGLYVLVCVALVGCSTQKSNPAGSALVDRDPGEAVSLPPISLASGESFQELVLPLITGQRTEVLLGQMNGFHYQGLFRFRVPVDSLAKLSGSVADSLIVESATVRLGLRGHRLVGQTNVVISQPKQGWGEIQSVIDSVKLTERAFLADPIVGASGSVVGDTSLVIQLPVSHLQTLRQQNATAPQIDLMVAPNGGNDFLLDVVAREAQTIVALGRHPRLAVSYRVGSVADTFYTGVSADTYWPRRVAGGPSKNKLIVSKGTFYSSILHFDLPNDIPRGITVNSAQLELDLDLDRSYFTAFPFEIYHVEFAKTVQDTIYTLYNTQAQINPTTTVKLVFNQSLIQAWIAGAQVNEGMAIRAVGTPLDVTWLVIKDARLNVIYSTPPEL